MKIPKDLVSYCQAKTKQVELCIYLSFTYCQLRNIGRYSLQMEGVLLRRCTENNERFHTAWSLKGHKNMVHHRKCERLAGRIPQGISKTVMYRGKFNKYFTTMQIKLNSQRQHIIQYKCKMSLSFVQNS